MTPEEMKTIRDQRACTGRVGHRGIYALENAQECNHCLMLVDVCFQVIHERIHKHAWLVDCLIGEQICSCGATTTDR